MLRAFPFVTGNDNTSPDRQRSVDRARERAQRYANITGTDERRNSRSHSGTPRRGSPSSQGGPIPQPVFLNVDDIPQVQIPPGFNAPLRNLMPVIPPLSGHRQERERGPDGRYGSVNPPPQAHVPMNLDDPFGLPMPPVLDHQRRVINLDDDNWPAPVQQGQNLRHGEDLAIPPNIPMPPPMHMQDVNGMGMAAHNPARIVGGSRHGIARVQNERHRARQPHPTNPNKLWCTTGRHYVLETEFGARQTCEDCRRKHRERAAIIREQEHQQAVQAGPAIAQVQLQDQIEEPVQNGPVPEQQEHDGDPLSTSAVSDEDKVLLKNCRQKLTAITMESCNFCHEEWFDLNVTNGKCKKCTRSNKWQASNNMYPGPDPDPAILPPLTQMEEMLISPVHALVQLWQIRGGQTKYTGHICNFPRNTAKFISKVPLLPEECDILVMRRKGVDAHSNTEIYQDFRVRREALRKWLQYLELHHPSFHTQQVQVDYTVLNQLPEDELVHDRLRTMEHETLDDAFQDVGPPEASDNSVPPSRENPLYSMGFVPNVQQGQTEEQLLRQVALQSDDPVIMTMPSVHGTPLSEHAGLHVAIDAFPTLFPTGKADFNANRENNVDMKEWAAHLMRLKGGRFARHPRFRYWVLNTIMRQKAKGASNWYLNTHKDERNLTVEDIREMLESGDGEKLAQRVSHAGVKLPGSKPFWQNGQRELIAQIRSPDVQTPHVFFTCSSADIQWPDLHQHMPNHDPHEAENATSYRTRMCDLNDNPAIAAYYFQKRWEVFFEEVIKPKFKIKDFWWRYEWQHRGSSHVHGFLWLEDAPSVDGLDRTNAESIQNYINFWDQHVSTWHPNLNQPPAPIHPSAQLFHTLQDTKKELAEMLNRLQRHTRCAPGYCERRKKNTGETFCRFGYPKQCRDQSELSRDPGREFAEFNTRRNDSILNSYNSTFILGWRANIDFRPVINKEAVIAYVAKYASKGETASSSYEDTLQKAIKHLQNTDHAGIAYQKMLSSFAAERDISSQETCHILYSLPLIRSSRKCRHLDLTMDKTSDHVNFESLSLEKKSLFDRYKIRPIDKVPALASVSLLEFATWWDWDRSKYSKRGSRGAKPYVVNVFPRYQPDSDNSEVWEKYCYAKMVLHHPFKNSTNELLKDHVDWSAAYQTDCLDKMVTVCIPPLHLHVDSLPDSLKDKDDNDDDSDSESIIDEDHEAENFRAEWMQEAGRRPNQRVEVDFGNLGSRDLDLAYDWNQNSANQSDINVASKWLTDQIRESPNDIAQDLPDVDYRQLKGKQRQVFLQVMAYFKKLKAGGPEPPLLRINVDGTAGTGKSFLIWTITFALRELFHDELGGHDPVVRLAPTGIAAFGIRGWTINYGLIIPVKEGKEFNQLGQNGLSRLQARWKKSKLLILDEKSMVGRAQMGRCDRRLRQAFPQNLEEILGGLPAILFGDFAQLPPIGDTPLYSTKESHKRSSLHEEGRRVFESFNQSVTLDTIYRQAGGSADQVAFRSALMRLRTYSTTQEDYDLLSTRTWDNLTPIERAEFDKVLHLLPTRAAVHEINCRHLVALGKPVLCCKAKHNHSDAKKASDDDADGLEKEILLAEGAKVMLTRNLWTAKGIFNIIDIGCV